MGVQIPTSVTILQSLHGYFGLSITNPTTSAVSAIGSGSVVEVAGSFFRFESEEAVNSSSWTAIVTATTAYLALTPSGSAGSQTLAAAWTSTAPTWRDDKYGWYASAGSSTRVVGSCYKVSATQQETKTLYIKGQDTIFQKVLSIGEWNMTSGVAVSVKPNISATKIYSISCYVHSDDYLYYYPLEGIQGSSLSGFIQQYNSYIYGNAIPGGLFDSTYFNATASTVANRGYFVVTYQG